MAELTDFEGTAAGAPHSSSERPKLSSVFKLQLGASESAAPVPAPLVGAGAAWEEFPASVHEDESREYKSDSDFQAMISQLATKITETSGSPTRPRPVPGGAAGAVAEADAAVSAGPSQVERTARTLAVSQAPGKVEPVATVPPATVPELVSVVASAVVPEIVEVPLASVPVEPTVVARPVIPSLAPVVAAPKLETTEMSALPALAPAVHESTSSKRSKGSRSTEPRPVDFHSLLKQSGMDAPTVKLRKKRHPFRVLFKLVLVLAIFAGGAYAAKKYYFDVRWAKDVSGLADDVATRRELAWNDAVKVVELPRNEYALRLASSMLGVQPAETVAIGAEWRAMGLTSHGVDLVAIGSAAMADQPAFYDPTDRQIYQLEGISPTLREVALSRALTNALLDQHHRWSTAVRGDVGAPVSASVALGVRALFDGDALAVRAATTDAVLADPSVAAAVSEELRMLRVDQAPAAQGASPYAVALTGSAGVAGRALFTSETTPTADNRDRAEEIAVESDAAVFDGARGRAAVADLPPPNAAVGTTIASTTASTVVSTIAAVASVPASTGPAQVTPTAPAPPTTLVTSAPAGSSARGMVYWYYVLAGRIDPAAAWDAAVRWQGDGTVLARTGNQQCVDATVVTKDAADQQVLLAALTQWADAGPAAAEAAVSAMNDTAISVHSCDPGTNAETYTNNTIPLFGNAPTELLVASGLLAAGLPRTEGARACVVTTVRANGAPPMLQSSTVDSSLTAATLDLTSTQVRDLIATCASQ